MMDLKELIKWLILCLNFFTMKKRKIDSVLTFLCIFLFFKSCTGMVVKHYRNRVLLENNIDFNNLDNNSVENSINQSIISNNDNNFMYPKNVERSLDSSTTSLARTFGGPRVKKLLFSLVPVIFQLGAASTWALVSALVGIKTLAVALVILKLMLLAVAAKFGAFFATKGSPAPPHGWEAPSTPHKEIHLHIHGGHVGTDVHQEDSLGYGPWSRQGSLAVPVSSGGPQTISTPFGHYVKVDPSPAAVISS